MEESFIYFYKLADGTECATTNETFAVLRSQQENTNIVFAQPIGGH
jgi:hypothetical protein